MNSQIIVTDMTAACIDVVSVVTHLESSVGTNNYLNFRISLVVNKVFKLSEGFDRTITFVQIVLHNVSTTKKIFVVVFTCRPACKCN